MNHNRTQNGARKTTSEIDNKNQIEEQFISSQPFHRISDGHVRKTTAGERFEPRNLESFGPATQESYQNMFLQRSTPKNHKDPNERTRNRVKENTVARVLATCADTAVTLCSPLKTATGFRHRVRRAGEQMLAWNSLRSCTSRQRKGTAATETHTVLAQEVKEG
jgi:hypothetical protein